MARQNKATAKDGEETMLKVWGLRQPPHSLPQIEIAKRLKITQSGVSKALKRARKLYGAKLQKGKDAIAEDIAETVERLEYIYSEAVQAWERSKKNIREVSVEKNVPIMVGGREVFESNEAEADEAEIESGEETGRQKMGLKMTAGGLKTVAYFDKVKVTKVKRDGNQTFLFAAIGALDKISEIKGIKAPVKTALTNPEGDKEAGLVAVGMADKELANRLLSILGKAKKRKESQTEKG